MKSPFPGMDPYLEQYWRDVHHRLVTYACDQLQAELPGDLRARMEERVYVETDAGQRRVIYPDVHVVQRPKPEPLARVPEGGVAVAEPLVFEWASEPVTEGYVEIVETGSGNRVVTVIEFLSPANKLPGAGQRLYFQKQREVQAAGANMVEIDLIRSGQRSFIMPEGQIPASYRTTYQVCVWRGWRPDQYEFYPAPLQQRLPAIRIPLRETDRDVPLDLQALVDQCYHNGRYDDLDYRSPPNPPLDPPEAAWADELLRTAGLR